MSTRRQFLIGTVASAAAIAADPGDFSVVVHDGKSPNLLCCDTTLRQMLDGSWVLVMLGGGDKEPLPDNRIFISRSHDRGKTWTPMQPIPLDLSKYTPQPALVPSELMVHDGKCRLFFACHDGRFREWTTWYVVSHDSCRTWDEPQPVPAAIHHATFVRNTLVRKNGELVVPFQHYESTLGPVNPRNGVMISKDKGRTFDLYGDIRISDDDSYHGFAENNIVEFEDGRMVMLIRADRLGGVLFQAESTDGGRAWSKAKPTDIPNPGSKATLYPLGGNRAALLHNPNPKVRNPLSLWVTSDGMRTWGYKRDLVTSLGRLNYPDGFVSKDGRYLHFAYDDNRSKAVYYAARLPEK